MQFGVFGCFNLEPWDLFLGYRDLLWQLVLLFALRLFLFSFRDIDSGHLDTGYWTLDTGNWILDTGHWIPDTGYWILDLDTGLLDIGYWTSEHWILDTGYCCTSDSALRALHSACWAPHY